MNSFIKLFDRILFHALLYVAGLSLLLHFTHSLPLALILPAALAVAIELGLSLGGVNKRRAISRADAALQRKCINQFTVNTARANAEFFFSLCGKDAELKGGFVTLEVDGIATGLFPAFTLEPLSADGALGCCKRAAEEGLSQLYILTGEATDAALRLVSGLAVKAKIVQGAGVFRALKAADAYPEITAPAVKTKEAASLLRSAMSRKRFKGYLFTGLFILGLSFLTPFKTYYICFSAVLLTLSALCLTGRFRHTDEELPELALAQKPEGKDG